MQEGPPWMTLRRGWGGTAEPAEGGGVRWEGKAFGGLRL